MDRLNLGIIGCGVMGTTHAMYASESPRIDVVAVADYAKSKAEELANNHKTAKAYDNAQALINDDAVDAVVLALPTGVRTEIALQAFAAGKHVLVEKPVAMNMSELEQLIAAQGDLVGACCSSRYQFMESTRIATELVASGVLGPLRGLHMRHFIGAKPCPKTPRPAWRLSKSLNGGGVLVNFGSYDLDYLLGIAGWSVVPKLVLAQTWEIAPKLRSRLAPECDAETHFAAHIRCQDNCVISIERAESAPLNDDAAWQIIGTDGSLRLHMHCGSGERVIHDYVTDEEGVVSKTLYEGEEMYNITNAGPVLDFADAILDGREPQTSLVRSRVIQQITDAVYASAETGQCINI